MPKARRPRFDETFAYAWNGSSRPAAWDCIAVVVGGAASALQEGRLTLGALWTGLISGAAVWVVRLAVHLWNAPVEIALADRVALENAYEDVVRDLDRLKKEPPKPRTDLGSLRVQVGYAIAILDSARGGTDPIYFSQQVRQWRSDVIPLLHTHLGGAATKRMVAIRLKLRNTDKPEEWVEDHVAYMSAMIAALRAILRENGVDT